MVLIVHVTPRNHDGICALSSGSADASLEWTVDKRFMQLASVNEVLPRSHTIGSAKESRHTQNRISCPGFRRAEHAAAGQQKSAVEFMTPNTG